jgi:protein TonB
MDFLYRFRQLFSGPPAIIVMIIVVTTPLTKVMETLAPKELFEQQIDLSEPPPPPPPPKVVQEEQPQKVEAVVPSPPADVITKDSVVLDVKPAPPEPPRAIETPRVEAPVQAAPRVDVGAIQVSYERIIRGYLESIKRYPTSREARSQRPTGKVGIWLEVNRDGSLKDAGIAKTSDSIILDNAALATVRQGKFPSFPPEAYPGETSHRFSVSLEYNLEQQN